MAEQQAVEEAPAAGHGHHEHMDGEGHVVPVWQLVAVGGALLILTVLTYAATWVDFGGTANLLIALGIAVVKGSLVVLFFMHLYWDRPFNAIVFVGSLIFVALFIGITLLDRNQYQPDMQQDLYQTVHEGRYGGQEDRPKLFKESK